MLTSYGTAECPLTPMYLPVACQVESTEFRNIITIYTDNNRIMLQTYGGFTLKIQHRLLHLVFLFFFFFSFYSYWFFSFLFIVILNRITLYMHTFFFWLRLVEKIIKTNSNSNRFLNDGDTKICVAASCWHGPCKTKIWMRYNSFKLTHHLIFMMIIPSSSVHK